MTDLKYRIYDWALTVDVAGSKNSVAVARRVLVYMLNSHYDLRGLHGPLRTWTKVAELEATLQIPRATVNRALKRLETQGILRKVYRAHWIVQVPKALISPAAQLGARKRSEGAQIRVAGEQFQRGEPDSGSPGGTSHREIRE